MRRKELGKTGIAVSEIAFGGVEIGMPYGLGIHSQADMLPVPEAISLLHRSLDAGINFYDTARLYGASETIMGLAFEGKRQQVAIASKCRHLRTGSAALPDKRTIEKIIRDSLAESLRELRTDFIDIYMLHQADAEILRHETVMRVFEDLKKSGSIRATGVSTYSAEETRIALDAGIWDVIQLPFNLLDQQQRVHFEQAARQGVALVARSVLMKGLLSSRGTTLPAPLEKVQAHIQRYLRLPGMNMAQLPALATRFALSFPEIGAVLVGIDREAYLQQTLLSIEQGNLDEGLMKQLKAMAYPDPDFLNLARWAQEGWLK
ncbi:aldo/keto reductase [Chitinophaga alhagiae]|uniref:Aldo/keto reductase n=1 Tax=Chitinophaga alhagiae TaxID=2203219 RepID=A0ABM6W8U0_9BACT|nr:aldo/keto reductase [Chitinophaga alhagiae]AWO00335.1 aldo/keto reductase [Chitinophaga alhagiae]